MEFGRGVGRADPGLRSRRLRDRNNAAARLVLAARLRGIHSDDARYEFNALWAPVLNRLACDRDRTIVLRDYHSPNLLYMPERDGAAHNTVGIIDYQDALVGHPAFDLVSLLQDARLDVAAEIEDRLYNRYVKLVGAREPGFDAATFRYAYAALGAQRNTKILGIFCAVVETRSEASLSAPHSAHMALSGAGSCASGPGRTGAVVRHAFSRSDARDCAVALIRRTTHPEVFLIDTAMILGAGLGTRMRPLTDMVPKPLVRLDGRALIDHALDRLQEAGITRVVVNVHYLADQLEAHLKGRKSPQILISDERGKLLDTGGGVVNALPLLGDKPFLIHNADTAWIEGIGGSSVAADRGMGRRADGQPDAAGAGGDEHRLRRTRRFQHGFLRHALAACGAAGGAVRVRGRIDRASKIIQRCAEGCVFFEQGVGQGHRGAAFVRHPA